MFYDRFLALCAQKNVSPSKAAREIGINKATVSNWKHRKNGPSDVTVLKISDYFGVPVSVLTEEIGEAPHPDSGKGLDAEILHLLDKLTPEELNRIADFARGILSSR